MTAEENRQRQRARDTETDRETDRLRAGMKMSKFDFTDKWANKIDLLLKSQRRGVRRAEEVDPAERQNGASREVDLLDEESRRDREMKLVSWLKAAPVLSLPLKVPDAVAVRTVNPTHESCRVSMMIHSYLGNEVFFPDVLSVRVSSLPFEQTVILLFSPVVSHAMSGSAITLHLRDQIGRGSFHNITESEDCDQSVQGRRVSPRACW
eukprot:756254-Hanusia_phi.AAC.4